MIENLEWRIAPATFVVTTLADSGEGSLREAIVFANERPGADVITFHKSLEGLIAVIAGHMVITDELTIKGPGAQKLGLDADFTCRFFFADDGDESIDSPLRISGLAFYNGEQSGGAGERGGAILSVESLTIGKCSFVDNQIRAGGGAISLVQLDDGVDISLDIRDSYFAGNRTENFEGGAVETRIGGSAILKNNRFASNEVADGSAGGAVSIRVGESALLLVEKCKFTNNTSSRGGAANLAGAENSTIIVRGSQFFGNEASLTAGGALLVSGETIVVEGSIFSGNDAVGQGAGLVAVDFSSLLIRSSEFLNNVASGPGSKGGALHLTISEGSTASIFGTILSGNRAMFGGGIFVDSELGSLRVAKSTLVGNTASADGGGLYVFPNAAGESASIALIGSKLISNAAEGRGGGFFTEGTGPVKLMKCQVIQNQGEDGGGLHLESADIVASLIARNTAKTDGGGILAEGSLNLTATKVLENSAGEDGGGIRSRGGLSLQLCIVSGNASVSGGGIHHTGGDDPVLKKAKVTGNVSLDATQIFID